MQQLFANVAASTLAQPVSETQTTITLSGGGGTNFPIPQASQFFSVTLVDAATRLENEIIYVTAASGDVLTVERGQEGTTPQAWSVGDLVQMFWTAGSANGMVQTSSVGQPLGVAGLDASGRVAANLLDDLAAAQVTPAGGKQAALGGILAPLANNAPLSTVMAAPPASAGTPGPILLSGAHIASAIDGTSLTIQAGKASLGNASTGTVTPTGQTTSRTLADAAASPLTSFPSANLATIATDFAVAVDCNAMSVGPITVAEGATVTVPDGSTWKVF